MKINFYATIKNINKKKNIFLLGILFLSMPLIVRAGILDGIGCIATGNCGLADVELGFQLLANWLLGGIGALALLYFIWGAGKWITSAGKADKVSLGKDIMVGSITALIIAFISYILIQFFINDVLLGGNLGSEYRVSAECVGQDQSKRCNEPLRNYFCSGTFADSEKKIYNNICVTRCELQNINGVPGAWSCVAKGSFNLNPGPDILSDACSTEEEVCINTLTLHQEAPGAGGSGSVTPGQEEAGICHGAPIRVNPAQCNDASSGLTTLIRCISQNLEGNVAISSISDDRHIGNLQDCQGSRYSASSCAHAQNSCHYGGRDQRPYSCAVDLVPAGSDVTMNNIETIARDVCNAHFVLNESDHIHASVAGCDCN